MRRIINRSPLAAFFVLAFLGSWILWSPMWLTAGGVGLVPVEVPMPVMIAVNQLGLFGGPFAAALVVSRVADGRGAVRALLARLVRFRFPWWCWLVALVGIPVIVGGIAIAGRPVTLSVAVVIQLVATAVAYLLGGPLQEEVGWRGFALPRMQARLHPAVAAVVLGLVHAVWHAPLFLVRDWDTARGHAGEYVAYVGLTVGLAVVLAWLTNASSGSLVPAVLGHNGVNWALASAALLTGAASSNVPAAVGLGALAVVALVVTRGRLAAPATPAGPAAPDVEPTAPPTSAR